MTQLMEQPSPEAADGTAAGAPAVKGSLIQTQIGRIVSDKMDKTVTVLIEHRVKHPLYGKVVTRSRKYHAHDESNEYKEGDLVEIEACRKLAKTKDRKHDRVASRCLSSIKLRCGDALAGKNLARSALPQAHGIKL